MPTAVTSGRLVGSTGVNDAPSFYYVLMEATADGRLRTTYSSPAVDRWPGRPARAGESAGWLEAIIADDRPRVAAALRAAALGVHCDVRYRMVGVDGAVRRVRERSRLLEEPQRTIVERVISEVSGDAVPSAGPSLAQLTPRQREALAVLCAGHGTRDVAAMLGVSEHTARNHVNALLRRLGCRSRSEAVALALGRCG